MPEGHTIHRLARDLGELVGRVLVAESPQGRVDASRVDGHELLGVDAVGKHLLLDSAVGLTVHVHLGMRGKFLRFAPVTGPPLRQVRLRVAAPPEDPEVAWDLIAPSACDLWTPSQRSDLVAGLGPDPLRADADPDEARRRLQAFRGPVGAALMDQRVLAGVGNVFRAEILHARGIAPTRPARAVTDEQFDGLWLDLTGMMARAVDDGRIVTVDAPDRTAVPEQHARRVYKQQVCDDCGTPVETTAIDGRTSYSCPRCQPD